MKRLEKEYGVGRTCQRYSQTLAPDALAGLNKREKASLDLQYEFLKVSGPGTLILFLLNGHLLIQITTNY